MQNRIYKFRAWDKEQKMMVKPVMVKFADGKFIDWPNLEFMQFTGLFDKNRKEIYEGDIIEYPKSLVDKNGNLLRVKVSWDKFGWFPWTDHENINEKFLVIGNVFENPELLT